MKLEAITIMKMVLEQKPCDSIYSSFPAIWISRITIVCLLEVFVESSYYIYIDFWNSVYFRLPKQIIKKRADIIRFFV